MGRKLRGSFLATLPLRGVALDGNGETPQLRFPLVGDDFPIKHIAVMYALSTYSRGRLSARVAVTGLLKGEQVSADVDKVLT